MSNPASEAAAAASTTPPNTISPSSSLSAAKQQAQPSSTGSSGGTTPNNSNETKNPVSAQLRWHSRSGSTSSHDDASLQRFEVPISGDEVPKYQLSESSLSQCRMNTISQRKYVVVMVGLPARGKTFIAQKLCRMLAWLGHGAVVHNVQPLYRASLEPPRRLELSDFDLRDPNSATTKIYLKALDRVAVSVREFFDRGGLVAFINDDFVSKNIRDEVEKRISVHADQTIYVEVTRDAELNIQNDLEKILMNPKEFGHLTSQEALVEARKKFYERVELLKKQYTSVSETCSSFIQMLNGKNLQACNVRGYIPSRMTSVLLNLNSQRQRYPIYFSRHGESAYNLEDRIGGNPPLTAKGQQDALYLRDFIGVLLSDHRRRVEDGISPDEPQLQIWASQLDRTMQTAQPAVEKYGVSRLTWHNLNEIHAGVCEDMTYSQVKEKYPSIDYFRSKSKYTFRYPQGESYQDIVQRLEPFILELENADREIVVVAHQAILRALLSYFGHKSAESSVHQTVPHRTIWRVTYNADGISSVDELSLPLEQGLLPAVPKNDHTQTQTSTSSSPGGNQATSAAGGSGGGGGGSSMPHSHSTAGLGSPMKEKYSANFTGSSGSSSPFDRSQEVRMTAGGGDDEGESSSGKKFHELKIEEDTTPKK